MAREWKERETDRQNMKSDEKIDRELIHLRKIITIEWREKERNRQAERNTDRQKDPHTDIQLDWKADMQTGRETERRVD